MWRPNPSVCDKLMYSKKVWAVIMVNRTRCGLDIVMPLFSTPVSMIFLAFISHFTKTYSTANTQYCERRFASLSVARNGKSHGRKRGSEPHTHPSLDQGVSHATCTVLKRNPLEIFRRLDHVIFLITSHFSTKHIYVDLKPYF